MNDQWSLNTAPPPPSPTGKSRLFTLAAAACFPHLATMKTQALLLAALLAAFSVITTHAAGKLGDPAAPLAIKEWVKGKPIDVKDGKNIYVVEFWATWCGPCLRSIPHLSEMQKKFKDKGVVFVGISDEASATVKPFVEKMGEKMDYTVACDDERKSNAGYMGAYGQGGIPTAFIVGKDGKVQWFGHPMAELEKTLEQIIAGKLDLKAAGKADEARATLAEYQQLAKAGDPKAKELGQQVVESAGDDVDALVNFAMGIVGNTQAKNRDFALADAALDKAEKTAGKSDSRVLGTRSISKFEVGQQEEGLRLAKLAVTNCKDEKEKPRYEYYVKVMEARSKQAKAKDAPAESK